MKRSPCTHDSRESSRASTSDREISLPALRSLHETADRLFRVAGEPAQIGACLAEVVASHLPAGTAYEFFLLVHEERRDRYRTAGHWRGQAPRVTARPYEEDTFPLPKPEEWSSREVFIPLECQEGVLGFALVRSDQCDVDAALAGNRDAVDFIGRLAGEALLRHRELMREDFYRSALASSTRYLETILAATGDAVLLVDRQGRVLVANESVEPILGLLPIDVTGRILQELVPNETAVSLLTGVSLAVNHDVPVSQALRLHRGDGRTITVDALFESVQSSAEGAPGVIICLRDLAESGSEDSFLRGQRRRTQACAEFGQSLLQPIAAMRGYLWLLRDELGARGRVAGILSTLDEQAEWMQAQLEALNLMDEFRTGHPNWRDRPVSPAVIFERAEGRVRARLDACGVRVDAQLSEDLDWIRVDVEKWIVVISFLLRHLAEQLNGPGRLEIRVDRAAHRGHLDDEGPTAPTRMRFTVKAHAETDATRVRASLRTTRRGGLRTTPRVPGGAELDRRGVEAEYAYGMPLARSVIHHYGGTLVWDVTEPPSPSFSVTLPEAIHAFSAHDREAA